MNSSEMIDIAQRMVTPGKGLLAADESTGTIEKRFKAIGVENTEQNRRDYRELLFRTDSAMSQYISGAILYDETIRQKAGDGTALVDILKKSGVIPGIKVDKGAKPLAFSKHEAVTEGLDGLRERFKEYYQLGARFAKWRATFTIASETPSHNCIQANTHALARYAALAQENGLVPIVEPEVLMDGNHTLAACESVTGLVLQSLFDELDIANVILEATILKPNMVLPGNDGAQRITPEEVAAATIRVLKRRVPPALPGIAFLSGGQEDIEATANLSAINRADKLPWQTTFSFGRALQAAPQKAWLGHRDNVSNAQAAFEHRARMNSLAAKGNWDEEFEARDTRQRQ